MRLALFVLLACCFGAGCRSDGTTFDAADATKCLAKAHAFINHPPAVPGAPPAKSLIDFGFPLRSAPLNKDHGTIVVTKTIADADSWMNLMRRVGAKPSRFDRKVVVVWDSAPHGHPATRRVVQRCLRFAEHG